MDEIGDPTVACERLLAAVDRLRGERDTLRRSLEFVRMEHKFAVESLEKKLSASLTQSQTIVTPPHPSPMLLRSQRATLVFALVVQHLYSTCDAYQTQVYYLADNLEEARNNLETAEQVSAERVEVIMELEADADAMQDKLGDSEARFVEAESQIQALHARILTLEQERDRERAAHEEAGVSLTHAEAQLTEVTKSLENVESERDSLGLRVTHLEQDLETAQNEVEEVEARYHQLQSQQLSSMSSSEATRALRSQIEELEGRVLRRTEQIGIHQHDIKRLETNSRLQEDRITEMAGELEELRSEKEALLDDCRTTREERGEAMRKCEDLEEAIEVLEERNAVIARQRDVEMHSMVGVVFQGAATRRFLSHAFTSSLARRALKESSLNGKLRESEDYVDRMSMQHTRIRSEHECALRLVEEKDALLKSIDEERQSAIGKAEGTSSVLSALESQLRDKTSELEVSKHDRDSVQVQLEQLRDHLRSKVDELSTLQAHYDALQTSGTQALASDRVHFTQQIKQLEERCDSLQGANLALESKLEQATQELNQAKEELVVSVSDGVERALAEQTLHAELENLRSKYEEDTQKLQDEISHTRVELEDIQRQRADLKATHSEELERATQSRSVIETRLAEAQEKLFSYESLQRDHQDLQERHSLDVNELRQQLTRTEQDLENAAVNHDELIARHQNAVENLQQQLDEATTSLQARATLELEFSDMKTQHADQVRSLEARIEAADQQTQELRKVRADLELRCVQLEEHTTTSSELETRLSRTTAEVGELQAQLRSKAEEHARAEKEFIAEMKAVTNRSERAELSQTQLQEEVARVQVLLEEATTAVQTLQEERQNLQEEMTALGAEVQRSLSLQRHQESRLNEGYVPHIFSLLHHIFLMITWCSERELTALKEQLERARSDYVLAEKAGKSAEINLSLQTVQNEKLVSSLRKELAALRESSKLEGTVAELKEQNAEMEELLRAKCLEIEDNDDRFIEYANFTCFSRYR